MSGRFDSNLRFVEPGAPARGAFTRLDESVLTEGETTGPALRGLNDDCVPTRTRGSNQMAQIVFDIAACEAEIARK